MQQVANDAFAATRRSSADGLLHSGSHILSIADICTEGFREACTTAVVMVAKVVGEEAPTYGNALRGALLVHQAAADRVFADQASPGRTDPIEPTTAKVRTELRTELDSILDGILDDLKVGLAGGEHVRTIHSGSAGVSVDMRGATGQVMVHSPGATQRVDGDLISLGVDVKSLVGILSELRSVVEASPATALEKEKVTDAIINAEREVSAPTPDKSRLKRMVQAVVDTAGKIAVGASGNFVGRLVQWLSGLA